MLEVQQKQVQAETVIALQHGGPYGEIGQTYQEIFKWAQAKKVRPTGAPRTVFLSPPNELDPHSGLFEVCMPVPAGTVGDAKVTVKKLPAMTVAFAVVKGPYEKISGHYSEMLAWLSAEGLEVAGPPREIYLKGPQSRVKPEEYLTEIQFPVND